VEGQDATTRAEVTNCSSTYCAYLAWYVVSTLHNYVRVIMLVQHNIQNRMRLALLSVVA